MRLILTLLFIPCLCLARDWSFDVLMDGKLIGEHVFQLKEDGLILDRCDDVRFGS